MPSGPRPSTFVLSILDISEYYQDSEKALRLYFSTDNPRYLLLLGFKTPPEVQELLDRRVRELDTISAFSALASLEAAFNVDYRARATRKMKDDLSKQLRKLYKTKGDRVQLEHDLLPIWKSVRPGNRQTISELIGALRFRHHIAHGRHWRPKLGKRYDYFSIMFLAQKLHTELRFEIE